jgi:Flp pilus assembly protein TadD
MHHCTEVREIDLNLGIRRTLAIAVVQLVFLSVRSLPQVGTAASHIEQAHRLIAQGDTKAAIAEYEAATMADPSSLEAQGNLGVLQFFANQCDVALPHLKAALTLNPAEARVQALLGICQKRAGQAQEAERNLTAALPLLSNPKLHLLILSNLAQIEYARGELEQASSSIAELMKNEPEDPDVLYLAFRIYNDLADSARNKLTIVAPDSGKIHLLMAEEFIKAGDAPHAISQYELAIKADPGALGVHFELGEAHLKESLGEDSLGRATAELQLALKEDPRNAGAEAKLGFIEGYRSHPAAAEVHYRRALTLNPDQLEALLGLGGILRERGDLAKAAELYTRASLSDPLDETIHFRLAQIDRQLGKKADADHEMKLFKEIRDLKGKSSLTDARRAIP